ncbi:U-box domain-containing protein 4 [Dendrobium catenatum]|uniref:U-box domain-containing protein 4 n=1 Tax=Dendrobium catenatum TaxID=906689 RepID=A0A2I0WTT8_9ASPA|nr:U-box domain-containing protein 4 [Dendrobium catenatum]XP_020676186.1 U-box domain-containing protein 4 [Dendrobium catenatum]PKU79066.1 U-box domain-containing protein 4 [Dendrobium catenatum]
MARCEVVAGGRWSPFSAAGIRRRLLEAMLCGATNHKRKKGAEPPLSIPPPPDEDRRLEKLSELLQAEARESRSREEAEKKRKIEAFEEMQGVVLRLQETGEDFDRRRAVAAAEVRRLAKDNPEARQTLAMLGAIPPLVGLLDAEDSESHISALYALLNLGIGNDENKSAIVKAGAVHKMLALIESGLPTTPTSTAEAIVAVLLSLGALDANKPIIGASSGAILFLVNFFRTPNPNTNSTQSKDDALRALFNLSISPSNAGQLIDSGLVPCLIAAIGEDANISERALAVLSNLVAASPEGRSAVSCVADAFPVLVDVLNWSDEPGSQEKAAYILMVMAHKSRGVDRAAMAAAGITSALLELALVGSALAQKRASRILEMFSEDKGKEALKGGIVAVSAPIDSSGGGRSMSAASVAEIEEEKGMSEERRAVRRLVVQSWQNNMRRIARRANLPPDFAPSDSFRELAASSSKSLPF